MGAYGLSAYGLCRVAAVSPALRVADVRFNATAILDAARSAAQEGACLIVTPELSLTGHSCADLFFDTRLRQAATAELLALAARSAELGSGVSLVVGLPLQIGSRLYNVAAVLRSGRILGIVPKSYLPNYGEFYEARWFSPARLLSERSVVIDGETIPVGTDLLFALGAASAAGIPDSTRASDAPRPASGETGTPDVPHAGNDAGAKSNAESASQSDVARTFPEKSGADLFLAERYFGIEICEDLWAVQPPSGALAAAGAVLIANLSASTEQLGKRGYREALVRQQSARCLAAYVYAGAGAGESSTDVVYSGHCLIAENGVLLAQGKRFSFDSQVTLADIDLEALEHERLRNTSFARAGEGAPHCTAMQVRFVGGSGAERSQPAAKCVDATASSTARLPEAIRLLRPNPALPFVPQDEAARAEHCEEIFTIQQTALVRRLRQLGGRGRMVIGVSGGLDSTLALLVCVRALDALGVSRDALLAVTMPGFGTTPRTRSNATQLMDTLGVSSRTIPIEAACRQHFADIGHDPQQHDVVFENTQARERTQILMDLANQQHALVVGTGDLSEAALGWCTYGGDHISMYHVNIGVPKTLVRYLVQWCAQTLFSGQAQATLLDIVATPISPELLPPDPDSGEPQNTEAAVGPYALHDFFLYHFVRHGARPEKILLYATYAFADQYDEATIRAWLKVFLRRFFTQQFKRSCMPDGPKVGSVALSPRGDWRMPSDAAFSLWQS